MITVKSIILNYLCPVTHVNTAIEVYESELDIEHIYEGDILVKTYIEIECLECGKSHEIVLLI